MAAIVFPPPVEDLKYKSWIYKNGAWVKQPFDVTFILASSGNWNSTYTTVSSNSANWVKYDVEDITTPATWVLDEDNLGSNSDTKVPTQQSVKKYIDDIVTGINSLKGGYDASTDQPAISAGVGVLQGDSYYVETGGLFYTEQVDPGDLIIAIENGSNSDDKWVIVNRNIQDELIDKWNSNYTTTSANSANWQSTYTTVDTESANWDSTYNTVTSLSNTWDDQFDSTEIVAVSANWNSTYTTVTNESADWESTYTTVDTESANWDSTYSTVGTYSADWESGGAGNFCSTTVLLNEVSACDGTMSIDGILSASGIITTTLSADSVYFNTGASHIPTLGELVWDDAENTLDLGLTDGVVLQLGEEQLINAKAAEEIKNGQVVYASGAVGAGSGKIEVSLYSASSAEGIDPGATDELFFVGMATQDIALNNFGYITTFGKVRGVRVRQGNSVDTTVVGPENTNASSSDPDWELGTVLYISATAGRLTNTKPISPNKIIPAAMVIGVNGNQRTLFTRYEHGYHIDELHDVRVVNPSTSDVLVYDSILKTWANITSSNWESTYTTVSSNSASWGAGITAVVEDTTPELGGNLKVTNGRKILDQWGNNLVGFEVPNASGSSYLGIRNAFGSAGPSLKALGTDGNIDLNLQPKGSGGVQIKAPGGLNLNTYNIKSLNSDIIKPIANGNDSYIYIMAHGSTNNPEIGVVSTNANQGLTINAKGTGNIKLGNLPFDADQANVVGSEQDNYVLTYDHSLGSISLEASTFTETITTTPHTQVVDTTHNLYDDDTAGTQIAVTLLAPTSHKGETTHMKIGTTADVVLTPASGTINGAGSYTLTTQYQAVKVFSDGTNYFAMA